MDPKDRVETVAKTKAGARGEEASPANGSAAGADHSAHGHADAIVGNWGRAGKDVLHETLKRFGLPNEATSPLPRSSRTFLALVAIFVAAALAPSGASAWAPANEASIKPGAQTFTGG